MGIMAILRPDSKGRISLGATAANVSSYKMTIEANGKIILEPYVEIPLSEKWVLEDKELLEKLKMQRKDDQSKDNI